MDKTYAVLTGDLVSSTTTSGDYHKVMQGIADEIKQYIDPHFQFDIYRGDSFQALIKNPEMALDIAVIFKAGLGQHQRGKSINTVWDARISIGVGTVSSAEKENVSQMDGDAFVKSGRAMDNMKKEGALLKITTGLEQPDLEFAASCALVDVIISRWTTAQSEAIYLQLLRKMTQKEIGELLKTSQRAIGKRLEASNVDSLKPFLTRYKDIITWNFKS